MVRSKYVYMLAEGFCFLGFLAFYIAGPIWYIIEKYLMKAPTNVSRVGGLGLLLMFVGYIIFYKQLKGFIDRMSEGIPKFVIQSLLKILPIGVVTLVLRIAQDSASMLATLAKIATGVTVSCVVGVGFYGFYLYYNAKVKEAKRMAETRTAVRETNQEVINAVLEGVRNLLPL